jgi:predicted transcriptional regulator
VAENYNYYNDPKLIAERERIKAEKQAQKKESGWSILGDILSTAGSFSNSETSQSLKALGESIKAVANPDGTASETAESSASSEAQAAEAVAETSAAKPDVSKLQAEISAIDRNLEQVSAQQIELAQKRLKAKGQVTTAGALAVKVPTGANAARNFSPSRIRQQSKLVAEAQRPARNSVSSIDTQLQQLNERKAALLTRRKQLSDQINQLMNNSADNAEGQSSSSGKPAKQKQTVNLSIYRSSQEHLNSIGRQLSDLYTKYKDETQTFTSSDRSKVKSLQAEARKVRKNCLDQTGQTLPANSLESWNP